MADSFLCVGLAIVDLIVEVQGYPIEDDKCRAQNLYEEVGGNAAKNCMILSILGEKTNFMGCVGSTAHHMKLLLDVFEKYSIDSSAMVVYDDHPIPYTVCLLNKAAGTRTCIHHRGTLPELYYDTFVKANLKLASYGWIHFEGRYEYHDTKRQIEYLAELKKTHGYTYKLSVELEKASSALENLLDAPVDYLFISKDFSRLMGYDSMSEAALGLSRRVHVGATVICPWGEAGAAAANKGGQVVTSTAYPPPQVVNTLGAGDTFIAACMKALSRGKDLEPTLSFACKVAGYKCGVKDVEQLRGVHFALD